MDLVLIVRDAPRERARWDRCWRRATRATPDASCRRAASRAKRLAAAAGGIVRVAALSSPDSACGSASPTAAARSSASARRQRAKAAQLDPKALARRDRRGGRRALRVPGSGRHSLGPRTARRSHRPRSRRAHASARRGGKGRGIAMTQAASGCGELHRLDARSRRRHGLRRDRLREEAPRRSSRAASRASPSTSPTSSTP